MATNKEIVDYELGMLMDMAKALGVRACTSKAVAEQLIHKILHLFKHRHITHKCERSRSFASFHEGMHQCSCGFMWLNSYGK